MTAIVALAEGWIGGDSAISSDGRLDTSADPKVWRPRRGVLVGAAGLVAYLDAVAWIDWPEGGPDDAWIRRDLPARIEGEARRRGLTAEEIGRECGALVVALGSVWLVESGAAWRLRDSYGAIGGGAGVALGALGATPRLAGRERCRRALALAERHRSDVRRPFTVLRA